jgi:Phosphodiester glycosidase
MSKRLVLVFSLFFASLAFGQVTVTHPMDCVTLTEHVWAKPPMRFYVAQVDLTNPRVHLRLCPGGPDPDGPGPWETTLMKVSDIAERNHLDVAVNGSLFNPKDTENIFGHKLPYFEGNWARANGLTVTDGRLWKEHPENIYFPSFVVMDNGWLTIGNYQLPPKGTRQMVSGCSHPLVGGRVVVGDGPISPRTEAGFDAARKTLTLLVVDGRRPDYSVGMSIKQAAQQLLQAGCSEGIDLDNGGSSTLMIRHNQKYPVINTPSDGHDLWIPLSVERPVADALGVTIDPAN